MLDRSFFTRLIFSLLIVAALSVVCFADTIKLKDGSLIKGTIISFAGGKFVVQVGTGSRMRELTFMGSEVESIQFDRLTQAAPVSRNASYTPIEPSENRVSGETATDQAKQTVPEPEGTTYPVKPESNSEQPAAVSKPRVTGEPAKPIEWSVKVLADNTANGWTNTGFVVRKGQRIHIKANGKVSLGKGKTSPASGDADLEDNNKLLKNVATGAVLAVIGDDNNDFIYVGADREFTATRDGALFLGINEGNLDDNKGSFDAIIEIYPDGE